MNKGKFKYESCNFVSTRRWNVNRHIEAAHDGKATAFNVQSGIPSSQRNPSFSPMNKDSIPFWYMSEIRATKREFDTIELLLKLEHNKEEKALMHIYQELFDRVTMLEEFLDDKQKGEINIGVYLMYSLLTEDPIRTLDYVIYHYRNVNSKRKIIALASKFIRGDEIVSEILLSNLIKGTEHYRNVIKFQS